MVEHDCFNEGVVGLGAMPSDIVFVGIAPGRHEWTRTKLPFTGPSGNLLDALLQFVGLQRPQVFTTNLICWWNDKPNSQEIAQCRSRLLEELEVCKPKIIVPLGDIAARVLMPIDYEKFSQVRGGCWWSKKFNCWVLPTYHPAAYLHKDSKVQITDAVRDFRKINHYLDKPSSFGLLNLDMIHVIESRKDASEYLNHFWSQHDRQDVVAVDIETTYDKHKLLSMSMCCSHGTTHFPTNVIDIDWSPLDGAPVRWGFHHGMFDSPEILKHLGVFMAISEDSLLQSYSLDERGGQEGEPGAGGASHGVGIHGLKKLAREYHAAGFYEPTGKRRPQDLTPSELALYNSRDAFHTKYLIDYFTDKQIDDNVRDMYLNLLIPGANVHANITAQGAHIDKRALRQLKLRWLPEWLELEESLVAQAWAAGWPSDQRINLQSPPQLSKLMYDMMGAPMIGKDMRINARSTALYQAKNVVKSTNMYVLKLFAVGHPEGHVSPQLQRFASDLLDIRGLARDIQNYITGIEDDMEPDGTIHPEPNLQGTVNGRLAYKKPPVMTIPKARTVGNERAKIRTIFAPRNPKTHALLEADCRQAELWNAYFVSGDRQVLEDLMSGDFHARGAQEVFHVNKDELDPILWENYRDSYKIVVYGSFYGASAPALMGDKGIEGRGSSGNYHLLDTRKAAQDVLDGFNARYHDLYSWRQQERRKVQTEGEQQSLTGRKRRYFLVRDHHQLNQAINMPISSLSHDHLMAGWIELGGWTPEWAANPSKPLVSLLEQYDSKMWFEVHDAVVLEVSKTYVSEVIDLLERTLSKPRFGLPVGIPIDVKVGPNWLEMKKVEEYFASATA